VGTYVVAPAQADATTLVLSRSRQRNCALTIARAGHAPPLASGWPVLAVGWALRSPRDYPALEEPGIW